MHPNYLHWTGEIANGDPCIAFIDLDEEPRPAAYEKDTLRILVATDSHVGYMEDDPIRGDDSWQTFDEIMSLAKEHDVGGPLVAGYKTR